MKKGIKYKLKKVINKVLEKYGYKINKNNDTKLEKNMFEACIDSVPRIKYIFFNGEKLGSAKFKLNYWIPVFHKLKNEGVGYIVVCKYERVNKWIKNNFPFVNVIKISNSSDAEELVNAYTSINKVLYSTNNESNIIFIRINNIKHIFIGHGDSEKYASANNALKWYDEIWISGEAHKDRFINSGINIRGIKFEQIGRPRLEYVIRNNYKNDKDRNDLGVHKRLLVLPTWEGVSEGNNYSSLPIINNIISSYSESSNIALDIKFHGMTGKRSYIFNSLKESIIKQSKLIQTLEIIDEDIEISDIVTKYDGFICDISSVITDCLITNRPIIVYGTSTKSRSSSNMKFSDYCYDFNNYDDLIKLLENVILNGRDDMSKERLEAINYFINIKAMSNNVLLKSFL